MKLVNFKCSFFPILTSPLTILSFNINKELNSSIPKNAPDYFFLGLQSTDLDLFLKEINSIVELGAGIGMLASCFLKLNKNLKYVIIDIPPTLFFSEYYLKNIGFKVFGYQELVNNPNIEIDKVLKSHDAICLPTWKIDLLINK